LGYNTNWPRKSNVDIVAAIVHAGQQLKRKEDASPLPLFKDHWEIRSNCCIETCKLIHDGKNMSDEEEKQSKNKLVRTLQFKFEIIDKNIFI